LSLATPARISMVVSVAGGGNVDELVVVLVEEGED
jgi:hypothetical protein